MALRVRVPSLGGGGTVASGAGAAAGTGTASGVGAAIKAGVGAASGTGSASGVGVSTAAGGGAAAGTGVAAGVGASTASAAGMAAGAGSAAGVGRSTAASVGSSAGIGSAQGIGAAVTFTRPITPAMRMVIRYGETMVLRRGDEVTAVTLKGKPIQGSVEFTGNSAAQQQFRVKITPAEIEGSAWASRVPKRNDTLEIDGRRRAVLDVRPLDDRGHVELYELTVAG